MNASADVEKNTRWWDFPSAVILFLAIVFSAWRMQSANWTQGLEHVRSVALLAYMIGLAIGYSKFEKRNVIWLCINYMLIIFAWQWLRFMQFSESQTQLQTRIFLLSSRLFVDLQEFFARKPVNDPLFFIALLCIPYWFTSLIAGYQLTRYNNILAAIVPSGILLMVVHISDAVPSDRSWLVALFLLMCVLLIGRRSFISNRQAWKKRRVQVTQENGLDISTTMMVSAAILLTFAWAIPAALPYNNYLRDSWREMTRFWRDSTLWDDAFASAKKTSASPSDRFRDVLQLGTSVSQSQNVVFTVYVPPRANSLPRLYWRGRVYDEFVDNHWTISKSNTFRHDPSQGNIEIPDPQSRLELRFTFTVFEPQSTIYSAAQPIWVDQPVNMTQLPVLNQGRTDIFSISAYPALDPGDSYDTRALVIDPTIQQLRAATGPYPAWIKQRYLQLPQGFSLRVRQLAKDITATAETPYDKTVAITNYLRNEIQYKPSIPLPPENVDPLEYFLFDIKAGFCNYYATAEVLMLRAVGIPARLVVGYAQGQPDSLGAYYTVRELNAHAWPEVYFASLGWVEFEPTVNQLAIARPEQRQVSANPGARPTPRIEADDNAPAVKNEPQQNQDQNTVPIPMSRTVPLIVTGVILFAGLLIMVIRGRRGSIKRSSLPSAIKATLEKNGWKSPLWLTRWAIWSELTPIERSYQSINYALIHLGQPQPVDVTPIDRARRLGKLLPKAQTAIDSLTREHQTALFTREAADEASARRSAWQIMYETLRARIRIFIMGYN